MITAARIQQIFDRREREASRKAVEFLNTYLKPWTFVGDEPIAVALAQLLRDAAEKGCAAD